MATNVKNVMYVVHSLAVGGLEKCVVDLVNGIDRTCFKPMVCCLDSTGAFEEKISDKSIEIFEMKKKPGNDFLLPFRLAKLFRDKNVDIIHSGNWGTMVESLLGAKMAGVPHIVHMEQGMELHDLEGISSIKQSVRGFTKRVCSFGIDHIITVSDNLKEYVHGTTRINKDKIKVVFNSVDTEAFAISNQIRDDIRRQYGISENTLVIGSVGRLAEVKNFECLINAMKHVLKKDPSVKLFIIGDGPLRGTLQSMIDALQLESFVKLLGQKDNIPELLGLMDIYSLVSIFEGISISILEAMSAGLPVVATDVGGNGEIIIHEKTGLLVKSRNPEDLAIKLIQLIENPQKRADFSTASKDRVKEVFGHRAMVDAYTRLYA